MTAHRLTRTVTVNATPAEVWALIGGFGTLGDWHPYAPQSTIEDGADPEVPGAVRVFAIDGKVVARERLLGREETAYTYALLDPMVPISDFVATLAVRPHTDGAEIDWSADYRAGSDDVVAQLEELFGDGMYGAGLAVLQEKFAGA
ncbi:SRPBCC family protein [Streptomyces sp. NPDC021093]|uniref:SRPBCC family protein n=1 Tax=Streptomyces sp. NPDC021093 TaxID=3365112 RepID=UPI0037B48980